MRFSAIERNGVGCDRSRSRSGGLRDDEEEKFSPRVGPEKVALLKKTLNFSLSFFLRSILRQFLRRLLRFTYSFARAAFLRVANRKGRVRDRQGE